MSTRSDWLLAADYAEHVLPHLQVLYPGEGRLMPVVQALVIARGMADGSNAADQARLGDRDI